MREDAESKTMRTFSWRLSGGKKKPSFGMPVKGKKKNEYIFCVVLEFPCNIQSGIPT